MALITVAAEKGGVGKTRVAIHLAVLAVLAGVDVALLDTDRQGSALSWARIRDQNQVTPAVPTFALPQDPSSALTSLSQKYDLLVVDIAAQNYHTIFKCAHVSDLVVVPTGPDQQEIESCLRVFDEMKDQGPRHRLGRIPAYALFTRMHHLENSRRARDMRELFREEGVPTLKTQLAMRTAWQTTGSTGRALVELPGSDPAVEKAAAEVQALYDECLQLISP